jgi:hypothetical protein
MMLQLIKFRHNHHPSGKKMLAKFMRRGFSVSYNLLQVGPDAGNLA